MRNGFQRASFVVRGRGLTLGTVAERLAEIHGDSCLVEERGESPSSRRTLTYTEAAERVARWSGGVAGLAAPGDRVVVAVPNGYDVLLLCLAASRAGCIPVPINGRMRPEEIDHVVQDSGATVVLRSSAEVGGGLAPVAAVPAAPGDLAALLYTSGTTGKPKGARLTHRALVGQLPAAVLWPSALRRDEAVLALPVAHIMGFSSLLGLAGAGIQTCFLPTFRAKAVLDAIETRRATIFVGVPAMYRMLLEAGAEDRDLSSVRVWASGADVMPPELTRRFTRMGSATTLFGRPVGGAAFVEGYGMVESGGGAAVRLSLPGVAMPLFGGFGLPLPGYRFRVVDDAGHDLPPGAVGELWLKGPGVTSGYHGDDAATDGALTSDGWLRTGDLARKGALGTVAFAGRKKDVLMVGGYSVGANEVERALEAHPDVLEAAVTGLVDDRMGEVPVAAVRLAPGSRATADHLVGWATERLSSHKAPRRIVVVDELPRTGTGKVQKSEVRALFE
ncbi:MAG: AMP-binding protein [Acidimicrobiia bacterium]|nr:AMP-binding protein [Acidimicrobiia bacterium]